MRRILLRGEACTSVFERDLANVFFWDHAARVARQRIGDAAFLSRMDALDKRHDAQSPRARAILDQLALKNEGVAERLLDAQMKSIAAEQVMRNIVGPLANEEASWAKGLRLFDWHSIRTGFVRYDPISSSDVRGAYLIVREARDWTTSDPQAPVTLVRDLLWVRAPPGPATRGAKSDFEGYGRLFSSFNRIAYRIERAVAAGDWSRYQGSPLRTTQNESLDMEIACPSLERVDGSTPHFAMMAAHTRAVQSPGAWKAIILRAGGSGWRDFDAIEPELEMFCPSDAELSETRMNDLIQHLHARGIIGAFKEPERSAKATEAQEPSPQQVFREALIDYANAPDTRARFEGIVKSAFEAPDPMASMLAAWPRIAPSQIILPHVDNAQVTHAQVLSTLFAREGLSPDQVAAALAKEVSEGKVTMTAR